MPRVWPAGPVPQWFKYLFAFIAGGLIVGIATGAC